ncbi:MAG TPA: site-specific tyrosine recombinase/integron integrase [Dehalococcoidia bacterium]|nr:site-specific tyrosine recombinase/integron integrase [Dehalococcoidia bacterium]
MAELLAAYFRYLQAERNLSEYTLRNYRTDLNHFLSYLEEEEGGGLLEVDRHLFRRYLAHLKENGVAEGSIARKVSTIHSLYRFLVREGYTERDLLAGVSAPKRTRRLPSFLVKEHLETLILSANGDTPQAFRDRAILELMYAAGIRLSETVGLNLNDLNLDEQTLLVCGKGDKERMVVMGKPAAEALQRYLRQARPLLASEATEPALFLNREGNRLSARSVQLLVRRYARKAGLPQRVWPHLLRHSFATHMLDGGAELRVVQELLGHSNANTTQIYLHVTEERQRENYIASLHKQTEEILAAARKKRGREDTAD